MRKSGSFNIHALLAVLAIIVVVSGILRSVLTGGITASKKVSITFWNGFTGPDGIVMLDIINRFNAENPDVEVSMQRIPWATYYNKLTVAGSDGRGPAVFIVHADALPRMRRAGFVDTAQEVFQGPGALDPTDFDPYVLDRVKFGGVFGGVPLDIHPQGLYCDADMLKQAGIVDSNGNPKVPETKEEFLKAMQACTIEPSGKQPEKQWGFALTAWGANMRSLMAQFDGRYVDEKGNPVLNCREDVKALEFVTNLAKEGKVPPPANGLGWFGYRQKKVAMVWDGVFMLGDLMRVQSFNYLGGMIPTIGNHPGTVANSHVMCIRKQLAPKEKDAVIRFIRYVSNHSLDWAAAGQIPARVSLRKTKRFEGMQVQYQFSRQIPYMQYPPKTPVIFEFQLALDLAVEKAVRGQAEPKQALDDANKAVQDIIDRDRKEHPEDQGL